MFYNVLTEIESIFASSAWTAENIKMLPSNYEGSKGNATEWGIINILPSASRIDTFGVTKSLTGLVAIKIFVPMGNGQRRLMQIADVLDNHLQYKKLTNGTLESSYITVEGVDPHNEALYSASYFIPFTLYGE